MFSFSDTTASGQTCLIDQFHWHIRKRNNLNGAISQSYNKYVNICLLIMKFSTPETRDYFFFGPTYVVFELTCSLTGSKSSNRSVSGTLQEAPSGNLMTSSSFTLSIFPTHESITTSQNELLRG